MKSVSSSRSFGYAVVAVCFATGALLLHGCSQDAPSDSAVRTEPAGLLPLAPPAAPGSAEPSLALGPDEHVYASWVEPRGEGGHALRYAVLTPDLASWSDPRTIAEGDDWFVNWADFPALSVDGRGRVTAHLLVKSGADAYAYDVRITRQRTPGGGWSEPAMLHDDAAPAEHGFVSHVPVAGDSTLFVWLDGRKYARGEREMTLRARTAAADGGLGAEAELDARTCDCCQTSAVALDDGVVVVVYRDRSDGEVRDIAAVRREAGTWTGPVPVGSEGWEIAGCPVNGPSVDAQDSLVAAAWFTAASDTPRVLTAFSRDGGRSFGVPIRVDRGQPVGRADVVVMPDGSARVSWIERGQEGEDAHVWVRAVAPGGDVGRPMRVGQTSASRASGFPRMVRSGERLVFAWTRTGEPSGIEAVVVD